MLREKNHVGMYVFHLISILCLYTFSFLLARTKTKKYNGAIKIEWKHPQRTTLRSWQKERHSIGKESRICRQFCAQDRLCHCERFARGGWNVWISSRDEDSAQKAVAPLEEEFPQTKFLWIVLHQTCIEQIEAGYGDRRCKSKRHSLVFLSLDQSRGYRSCTAQKPFVAADDDESIEALALQHKEAIRP